MTFPELLDGGAESTPVALAVLVSSRKSRHPAFEPVKRHFGFTRRIKACGWIYILHFATGW
jgi:hypothetical protein